MSRQIGIWAEVKLYFASQKEAGMDIVHDIFNKYRLKQGL
jgi:hypothetical protein